MVVGGKQQHEKFPLINIFHIFSLSFLEFGRLDGGWRKRKLVETRLRWKIKISRLSRSRNSVLCYTTLPTLWRCARESTMINVNFSCCIKLCVCLCAFFVQFTPEQLAESVRCFTLVTCWNMYLHIRASGDSLWGRRRKIENYDFMRSTTDDDDVDAATKRGGSEKSRKKIRT